MKNSGPEAVLEQPDGQAHQDLPQRRTERASSRPSTGALSAWVKGTPKRAGPMSATVSIRVARLAPKPWRRPRSWATRARAMPPGNATKKPPNGTAREATKETVAT